MRFNRSKELISREQKQFRRFMVCYDGSPASMRALDGALDLAGPDTRISVVYFALVPQGQPLDHGPRGQDLLAQANVAGARVNAENRGHAIDTAILRCHEKGPAQVAAAAEYQAEVVFLGAEAPEFGETFDKETDYVLRAAPSKVVVFTA